MILDDQMPVWDATRIEHRVITGTPEALYDVVLEANFVEAITRSGPARAMIAIRGAAERAYQSLTGRDPALDPEVAELRLADLPESGDWVLLGSDRPNEIAFGAAGRFWAGETRWEQIDAGGFAGLGQPGIARIACAISLRPYGTGQTLVSYEARTQATDERSRRAFRRYWRIVSPFVGVIMRSTLALIDDNAKTASSG